MKKRVIYYSITIFSIFLLALIPNMILSQSSGTLMDTRVTLPQKIYYLGTQFCPFTGGASTPTDLIGFACQQAVNCLVQPDPMSQAAPYDLEEVKTRCYSDLWPDPRVMTTFSCMGGNARTTDELKVMLDNGQITVDRNNLCICYSSMMSRISCQNLGPKVLEANQGNDWAKIWEVVSLVDTPCFKIFQTSK